MRLEFFAGPTQGLYAYYLPFHVIESFYGKKRMRDPKMATEVVRMTENRFLEI